MRVNRFCPAVKPTPPPNLFLTDNIKIDKIPSKVKWKIHALLHCISSFEGNSCKTLQIQPPQIFYFWLFLLRVAFTSADIIFQNFIELHWILSENHCQHEFSIFNKLTHHPKRPHPVNGRNLLSVTKFFCWCSLTTSPQPLSKYLQLFQNTKVAFHR